MYSMSEFGMPPISRSPLLYFLNQKKLIPSDGKKSGNERQQVTSESATATLYLVNKKQTVLPITSPNVGSIFKILAPADSVENLQQNGD